MKFSGIILLMTCSATLAASLHSRQDDNGPLADAHGPSSGPQTPPSTSLFNLVTKLSNAHVNGLGVSPRHEGAGVNYEFLESGSKGEQFS